MIAPSHPHPAFASAPGLAQIDAIHARQQRIERQAPALYATSDHAALLARSLETLYTGSRR